MREHWRLFAFGAVFIVVLSVFIPRSESIKNYPSSNTGVIMFGDSLTFGVGASEGKELPVLIGDRTGVTVKNFGVSGDTTEDALLRLPQVLKEKPQVVIILLGGNDYLKRIPEEKTFSNLEVIIKAFEKEGSIVILCGVRGGILSDHFKTSFASLAKKMGTAYVPDVLDGLFGNNDFMSDEVHPNDKGYAIIASRISSVLVKLIH